MENSLRSIPSSYGNALRNISRYSGSFKAEEWLNFHLYYSSVLLHGRGRLRRDLFEHYGKLVSAIDIAIDYELTTEHINTVKTLLMEFVSNYEKLYYQYDTTRIPACLPTIHLLLHLHESISDCGPAWVFWQFPCERVCGMLKPMVQNRSIANRNLSLAILYREQFNHLPFAIPSWTIPPVQHPLAYPHYTQDLHGHKYSFLHPRRDDILSPDEASHLVRYYANIFECTQREINLNDEFNWEIVKLARCLLTGDTDCISC